MDCATFEHRLAQLLESTTTDAERRRRIEQLRSHAARCATCGGSEDLLQLLELPRDERDLAADPGPQYWADFDGRLRRRIEADASASPGRGRWVGLVAAAALLVLAAAWLIGGSGDGRHETVVEAQPAQPVAPPLSDPLARTLSEATPAELEAQLDALDDPVWGAGDLFPDVTDLDAEARLELLSWLKEQAS